MKNSTIIHNAIRNFPSSTLISIDDLVKKTNLNYFQIENQARAMCKDNFIHLAAICEVGNTPTMGVFEGKAKQKEYYFAWSNLNKKYTE